MDEPNILPPVVPAANLPTFNYNGNPIINSASVKYKSSIIGKKTSNDKNNNVII